MRKQTDDSDAGLLFAGKLFLIVGALIYEILLIWHRDSLTIFFDSCHHAGELFLIVGEWTIRKGRKTRMSLPVFAFMAMMTFILGAQWLGSLLALATLAWGLAKSNTKGQKPGNSDFQRSSRRRWVLNLWS